ncbi:MAG: PilT/PilU family type 4a pilus ATPase [Sulfuricurvum sp.]
MSHVPPATPFKVLNVIRSYLMKMVELKGSDMHIKAGGVIRARIQGRITPLGKDILSPANALIFAQELLQDRFDEFVEKKELDLVYPFDENTRFRVNIFFQMNGVSAVLRVIPVKILTLAELNLPKVVYSFVEVERGLVTVTGVTGSGKSTTLAAIINEINETKQKHIITIEDPIEFVHPDKQSLFNQRSIGQDTKSFASALRAALREDPDIILIGEMRDMETIEIALHAADTGHLVFSTLHTVDAKETINRIISAFPPLEQNRIRKTLSSALAGVISQRLARTVDGKRAAVLEVLVRTARIEQLIAENCDNEIPDAIFDGKELYGSQTFDQALLDLYLEGRVSKEDALSNATSPSDLKLRMGGLGGGVDKEAGQKGPRKFSEDEVFGLKK